MFDKFFSHRRPGKRPTRRPQRMRSTNRLRFESLEQRELMSASPFQTPYGPLLPSSAPAATYQTPQPLVGDALTRPPATSVVSPSSPAKAATPSKAPYGAAANDTSEYMIGNVSVTVVLLESNGKTDRQTENWTTTEISQVKREIQEGVQWWEDTFRSVQAVTPRNHLDFQLDFTYTDRPVATKYEPITRPQTDQGLWIDDFLSAAKYQTAASYFDDLDRWNDAQRQRSNTDWAFTMFVVDSSADVDGMFADGSHSAYGYYGGPFLMMTYDNGNWGIDNMGQVLAHETGHIFYALDEYPESPRTYNDRSGYYNTQNLNASNLNPNPASRVNSLMAEWQRQNPAYASHTSSPSSLEMIGWKDTDRDGIADVLDVPLTLTGSGSYNAATGSFTFSGTSTAGVLTNQNPQPASAKHAISINHVDLLQYRLDNGPWRDGNTYGTGSANVSQSVGVGAGRHTVDFRTVSRENGVMSPIWSQTFDAGAGSSVVINQTAGSTNVAEVGTNDTYTVVLATRPTANVVISIVPSGQIQVSPSKLTFTTSNWNKPQTVTVAAINDTLQEGRHTAVISHTLSSTDAKYKNVKVPSVDVRVADNDLSAESLLFVNRSGSGGHVLIADFHTGRPETQYRENWGDSELLSGWNDTVDLNNVGDFMGLGHDQVMFINTSGGGGKVMILDYHSGQPIGRYWENWGDSALLGGWIDPGDLQYVGDFMGLGYDQVMFINNGGSGGKVMILDYQGGKPTGRYWENWGDSALLGGWLDPGDSQSVGDFMGLGYDQVMFINNSGSGGKVMILDYQSGRPIGRYWENWGASALLGGWLDRGDSLSVGDFMGLGYDQVRFVNNSGSGGKVMILDFQSGRPIGRYWENWGDNPLLGGWQDPDDLQFVGDFMGLGHDQVAFINNSGSDGRVLIVDYQGGKPFMRFWENWASSGLLDGWHDADDLVLSGRFV